jgi:hypothetical protein
MNDLIGQIRYFKLMNGEDIIAQIVEDDEIYVYITNALKVMLPRDPNPRDGYYSYLAKWIPTPVGQVVPVPLMNIVAIAPILDSLEDYYHKYFDELEPVFDEDTVEELKAEFDLAEESGIQPDTRKEADRRIFKKILEGIEPGSKTKIH